MSWHWGEKNWSVMSFHDYISTGQCKLCGVAQPEGMHFIIRSLVSQWLQFYSSIKGSFKGVSNHLGLVCHKFVRLGREFSLFILSYLFDFQSPGQNRFSRRLWSQRNHLLILWRILPIAPMKLHADLQKGIPGKFSKLLVHPKRTAELQVASNLNVMGQKGGFLRT